MIKSQTWRMSFALSTSARAAITLASPVRLDWAAMESESCRSWLKIRSLMSMDSTSTPHPADVSSMISRMDCAISSRRSITSWSTRAPTTWRSVVWVRSTRAWRILEILKAALCGEVMR